jgi:hypothetical protein
MRHAARWFLAGVVCLTLIAPARGHTPNTTAQSWVGDLKLEVSAQVWGPAYEAIVGEEEVCNYATQSANNFAKITNTGDVTLTDIEFLTRLRLKHNSQVLQESETEGPVTLAPTQLVLNNTALSDQLQAGPGSFTAEASARVEMGSTVVHAAHGHPWTGF